MTTDEFPKTELEFHERFNTEEKCIEYFFSLRFPNGFQCPKCGCLEAWQSKKRPECWVCKNRKCGRQTSIRVGTVLHKSRKPLREWLLTMFLLVTNKQSISALRLQRLTGHGSYHTSTRWLRELRRAMGVELSKREQLGLIVEVDEMFIGGKDVGGKRGKGSEKKVAVLGAVEAKEGRCGRARFQVLYVQTDAEVNSFVSKVVQLGSVIKSDWTSAHLALSQDYDVDARVVTDTAEELEEYRKRKKRGEKGAKKRVEEHLPNFHRVTSLFKRVGMSAHQGSIGRHLQLYLDEYCFRFDDRSNDQIFALVDQLARAAMDTRCIQYWRSCGRPAPDRPTYRRRKGLQLLGLGGAVRG